MTVRDGFSSIFKFIDPHSAVSDHQHLTLFQKKMCGSYCSVNFFLNELARGSAKTTMEIVIQVRFMVDQVRMLLRIFLKNGVVDELVNGQRVITGSEWIGRNVKFIIGQFRAHCFGKA